MNWTWSLGAEQTTSNTATMIISIDKSDLLLYPKPWTNSVQVVYPTCWLVQNNTLQVNLAQCLYHVFHSSMLVVQLFYKLLTPQFDLWLSVNRLYHPFSEKFAVIAGLFHSVKLAKNLCGLVRNQSSISAICKTTRERLKSKIGSIFMNLWKKTQELAQWYLLFAAQHLLHPTTCWVRAVQFKHRNVD